jgi:transposase
VTDAEPVVAQRVEIAAGPLEAHEHRRQPGWCPQGRQGCYAPFPLSIGRGGLAGPRRTTVLASLKGACHASDPTIREYVRDVIGLTISRGQPAKILGEVSRAPERPDEERLGDPPDQAVLDVDEAGHKRNGQQHWTWCSRAGLDTWFKIDPTGGADVLIDVLGSEFDGVLGRDSASAYRRSHRESGVALRFGLAPLSREVKDLTTLPDARDRADGEGLRQAWRGPVAVIHRRGEWTEAESQRRLGVARDEVLWRGTSDVPTTRAAGNPAKRLEAHGASYFRLITEPGIEPTNDLAEQAIRFVGVDRAGHARDAGRARRPVVRADPDGEGDVQPAGAVGVGGSGGGGDGVARRGGGAVVAAARGLIRDEGTGRRSRGMQGPRGPGSPRGDRR